MSDFAQPAPPAKPPPEEPGEEPSLDYLGAWTYLFEAPSWMQDLLLNSVCAIVPIAGRMVVDGFLWERAAVANRELPGPHSPFDFNHLGRYLQRGIWPFVVTTLLNIVINMIAVAIWAAIIFGLPHLDLAWLGRYSERELTILVWSVGTPVLLLLLVILKLFALTVMAMTFHSERTGNFMNIFDFGFVGGFIYRVWLEGVLVISWIGLVAPLVMVAGLLCCIVGAIPASIVISGATEHFYWRLYKLYLARGGKPIPIKMVT